MSITDELREWLRSLYTPNGGTLKRDGERIADRIDAEHEAKVSYWQGASYKDGYDEGFVSADDWIAQHEDVMAEHGWVRLPVDADGEYIHIGDVMDSDHYEDGTVVGLQFFNAANKTPRALIAIRPHGWDTPTWRDPESYRHHHKPTVEDVLEELLREYDRDDSELTNGEIIERFAAKLRLTGDGDE